MHSLISEKWYTNNSRVHSTRGSFSPPYKKDRVRISIIHNTVTDACEGAICVSPCHHCSILTVTLIKCSTINNTAGSKSTDARILCAFIDIWLKEKRVIYKVFK